MAEPKETTPGDADEASLDEFDKLVLAFQEQVDEFAAEHDLAFGVVSLLAAQLSMTMRMFHYAASAEKPSASGLRLELDQFRREVEDAVRSAKKGADEFLEIASEAFAQAEADEKPQ